MTFKVKPFSDILQMLEITQRDESGKKLLHLDVSYCLNVFLSFCPQKRE